MQENTHSLLADEHWLARQINATFDPVQKNWTVAEDTFAFFNADNLGFRNWFVEFEVFHPAGHGPSVIVGRQFYEFRMGSASRPAMAIHVCKVTAVASGLNHLPQDKWTTIQYKRFGGVVSLSLLLQPDASMQATDPLPGYPLKDITVEIPKGTLFRRFSITASEPGGRWKPKTLEQLKKSISIDFNDDIIPGSWTEETVEQQIKYYTESGIQRIYFLPTSRMDDGYWNVQSNRHPAHRSNFLKTKQNLGDFLSTFAKIAKSHAMEFIAVLKPFEQAFEKQILPFDSDTSERDHYYKSLSGYVFRCTNWMKNHPTLRLARHPEDLALAEDAGPIARMILCSESSASKVKFSVWGSENNRNFSRIDCRFHTISDQELQIDLPVNSPRILAIVREDKSNALFGHVFNKLVRCYDSEGSLVPTSFAPAFNTYDKPPSIPFPDTSFRFDTNFASRQPVYSRESYWWMESGIPLGVTAGFEPFIIGAPSPAYSAVKEFWYTEIQRCIDAGCDGVDIRVANHNRTFEWDRYGYNESVGEGLNHLSPQTLRVRLGNQYTSFLQKASELIRSQEKSIHVHLEHGFRPAALPCDMNIEFQWKEWLTCGLVDEVTLMCNSAATGVMPEMTRTCQELGIPTNVRPYFISIVKNKHAKRMIHEILHDAKFYGVDGLNIYENFSFFQIDEKGDLHSTAPDLWRLLTNDK